MKNSQTRLNAATLILLLFYGSASAQLGGLSKLKSLAGGAGGSSSIDPDLSEHKFPPSVGFQSLLTELRLDPQKSVLTFGSLQFYFLPSKETNGNQINYRPSSADNLSKVPLRAELIQEASGETVETFYFELNTLQRIVSQGGLFSNGKTPTKVELEADSYRLDFYLGKVLIQQHPFEVIKTPVDDPYSPVEALYTIGGPWEKYALLQVDEDGQGGEYTLRFQPIINYHGIHTQSNSQYLQTSATAEMKCLLKQNGKIIGAVELTENTDPNDIFGDKYVPGFSNYKLEVEKLLPNQGSVRFYAVPKVTSGQDLWVQMQQIKDGDYTIEMTLQGMADRADFTAIYPFSVKGGRVVPADQGNRQINNNATTFLETGRDYVLIESK